jgi:hypothetical protein
MLDTMHSSTHFLKRDVLYDSEKPYSLRFTPPDGFARANISIEKHEIEIRDIRPKMSTLNFQQDGIAILPFDSRMMYQDYDDEDIVREILLKEIANALKKFLGAQHVQIFEHTVRPLTLTISLSLSLSLS